MMGVVSPAGQGASELVRAIAGLERLKTGGVHMEAEKLLPPGGFGRRANLNSLLARKDNLEDQERTTQTVMDLGLWEHRATSISDLPEALHQACRLVPALSAATGILILDGDLDLLDLWLLEGVRIALARLLARGGACVLATNRPDLLTDADILVVLKDSVPVFAGPLEDLWRRAGKNTLEVATRNQPGARALVEPFSVRVTETPDGLKLEAEEGQEIAARLLRDGYGDVRYVITRRPSLAEAIRSLVA